MKKILVITPLLLAISISTGMLLATKNEKEVKASGSPTAGSTLETNINLNDNTDSEIRSYYSDLTAKSASERTGTNILKNLRPILQNFTYYSYDAVWKIYEITDREWALSPAEDDVYGSYNANTNYYTKYVYSSDNSNTKNNPYVHTLYRNRDENGVTISSGRIREWGDHSQTGGTNREHVWCQSRGFKASSGANGPAGTDIHHLMSGDGYVNGKPHNNYPYGYVNPSKITIDSKDKYAYCEGNIAGTPLHQSAQDESDVVFEPQDSDKGDIARACFYMVACYNNLSGKETITQYNPNLTLADYATDSGTSESSSSSHAVAMGILSDLLEWNKLDPVDEYEIHRNNLIYNNYQHNRNPFIDFPQWADYIWGDKVGTPVNPATDAINYGSEEQSTTVNVTGVTVSPSTAAISVNETKQLTATISPNDASNKSVTWSTSDSTVAAVSNLGVVTGKKAGSATITATTADGGFTATCNVTVTESGGTGSTQATLYSGSLTEGDYVVFYNNKAMKNTVESNRLSYSEVTPSNNAIDNPNSSIVWHIAPSGDYWTIYNSAVAKYAASTGADNKAQLLTSGTDDKSLWTVSGTSTYEFVNKHNSTEGKNCNLRNNRDYGFACYSTSIGGALSLYKVSNTSSITLSSISTSRQTTEFDYNDTFVYDGTLTATYSNGSTKTVIPTSVSSPNMSSAGNQTVTITYTENGVTKTCSYTITVKSEVIPVTGVSLNKSTVTLEEDGNTTLVATITPNNATNTDIYWSSDDSSIATVVDGVVTGVAVGETTITVTTDDGEFTDTCTVTVTAKERKLSANTYGSSGTEGASVVPTDISEAYPLEEGLSWGGFQYAYGYIYKEGSQPSGETDSVLKLGKGGGNGYVTLNLDKPSAYITRVVVNAKKWGSDNSKLAINDVEKTDALTTSYTDYEYELEGTSNTSVKVGSVLRAYIARIDVYYKIKPGNLPEISIDKSSYIVNHTSNGTLDYTVLNGEDGTVTFSSSDENVLTIDNDGNYSTVGIGTAVVTATLTISGEHYTDTATFIVNGDSTIADVISIAGSIGKGNSTSYKVTVFGTVTSKSGDGTKSQNNSVYITDGTSTLQIYFGYNVVSIWEQIVEDAEVTVTGYIKNYNNIPEITSPTIEVGYTALTFANEFLSAISEVCSEDYDGVTSNKTALEAVWTTMSNSSHYGRLSASEKAILVSSSADEEGTAIEKAMAFYDYACKKYNLTRFIEGRTIKSQQLTTAFNQNNIETVIPFIVIFGGVVVSMTLLFYLRRKKEQ